VKVCPVCRGDRQHCIRVYASGIQPEVQEVAGAADGNERKSKSKKDAHQKTKKEHTPQNGNLRKKDKKDSKDKKRKRNDPNPAPLDASDVDLDDDAPLACLLSRGSTEADDEEAQAQRRENENVIPGTSRRSSSHGVGLNVSSEVLAESPAVAEGCITIDIDMACSALTRDYGSSCPTCKQDLGEVKWSGQKNVFTVKCVGTKKHTFDYFNSSWVLERVRQEALRAARATSEVVSMIERFS